MSAAIWWEPKGSDVVRKIDLGAPLSDLQELPPDRQEVAVETYGGLVSTVRHRSRHRIHVVTYPWVSYTLWDEVSDMVEALRRGRRISLAEDDTSMWAAYVLDWTNENTMVLHPGPWSAYGTVAVAGDRFRTTGPSPSLMTESGTVGSVGISWESTAMRAGGYFATGAPRKHNWSGEAWALARHAGFWPCLRMPASSRGQAAIVHKHRRSFTLELVLEVDMAGLAAISATPSQLLNGTYDSGNPTMSQLINANGDA